MDPSGADADPDDDHVIVGGLEPHRSSGVCATDDVTAVGRTTGWTTRNSGLAITQFYGGARAADGVLHGSTQTNGTVRSTATGVCPCRWGTTRRPPASGSCSRRRSSTWP